MATREELRSRVEYLEEFREGVLSMLREIDESEQELARAYKQLKNTQEQLIHSARLSAIGELAAGLAHEVSQPLSVIKGLSQNLMRTASPEGNGMEKLRLIIMAASRMEALVRHLRLFARSGCVEAEAMTPVDLNDVVRGAFLILNETLSEADVSVTMDLNEVAPVAGSANKLEQVLINLVTNAKDAMPGGGRLFVSTGTVKTGGLSFARLIVRDTGRGISPEVASRIFDPFFTTKVPGKGTGLGLSISYGIIKEHLGEITVESSPGRGSSFTVTLPAAQSGHPAGESAH